MIWNHWRSFSRPALVPGLLAALRSLVQLPASPHPQKFGFLSRAAQLSVSQYQKNIIKLVGLMPSCTFCKQFETTEFHSVSRLLQKAGESELVSEESCCVWDPHFTCFRSWKVYIPLRVHF